MKLQVKLILGMIITAVPVSVGIGLLQAKLEYEHHLDRETSIIRARMESGMREQCEAAPQTFPLFMPSHGRNRFGEKAFGRRQSTPLPPDVRLFAYDASFHSQNPHAPVLNGKLVENISQGDEVAQISINKHSGNFEQTLIRMSWETGPCRYIFVEHPAMHLRRWKMYIGAPLIVALMIALTMLFMMRPLFKRIIQLIKSVREGNINQLNDQTKDEIGELTRVFKDREAQINHQIQVISDREDALRRYISNTTHDVLLPVTVLQGYLTEMETMARTGEKIETSVAVSALEEVHYLSGLIYNLNAQARLDAELVVTQEVTDLADVVIRAVSRHRPIAERQGVCLDYAVPETKVLVQGDITLLEQAVSNLIANAVRYNHRGGHVAVILEIKSSKFTLEVIDDGPGVPEEMIHQLGVRGFRTNTSRTRYPEGQGLGLQIVHEIINRHEFNITFRLNEPTGLSIKIDGNIINQLN